MFLVAAAEAEVMTTDSYFCHKILYCLGLHFEIDSRKTEMGIQSLKMGIQNLKMGILHLKMGIQSLKMGIQNHKMGILHLKMGIQSLKMGIQYLNNIRYIISFLRSTKNIIAVIKDLIKFVNLQDIFRCFSCSKINMQKNVVQLYKKVLYFVLSIKIHRLIIYTGQLNIL